MSATASWVHTEGQWFSGEGHRAWLRWKVVGSGGLLLLVCEAFGEQQQESTVQTLAADGHTQTGARQASEVHQVVWLGSVLAVRAAEGCSPLFLVIPSRTTRPAGIVSPCLLANDDSTQGVKSVAINFRQVQRRPLSIPQLGNLKEKKSGATPLLRGVIRSKKIQTSTKLLNLHFLVKSTFLN